MSRLRVGAVPYLNARPLVEGLADDPAVAYREDVPARLAAALDDGALDVALVSSVEALRAPARSYVEGLAIASAGPVESVLLAGPADPRAARTVALDGASLTAAALTRLVYGTFLGRRDVVFQPAPPAPDPRATGADATLVIGDAALRLDVRGLAIVDLGALWTEATGLPFVWAVWLLRPGADADRIRDRLHAARRAGAATRDARARAAAHALGLPPVTALRYLRQVMRYDLGPAERQGLSHFGELLAAASGAG